MHVDAPRRHVAAFGQDRTFVTAVQFENGSLSQARNSYIWREHYSAPAGQPDDSNKKRCRVLHTIASGVTTAFIAIVLVACGQTSAIQATDKSKSHFADAVFKGETVVLRQPTQGGEQFRLFQQGATGYVSLQSVRDDVDLRAVQFCDRKGQTMNALQETTSTPPYIFGNFPRAELVFECVAKAAPTGTPQPEDVKFTKLNNLKKLLDSGALTQAEFEQEKKKVLSQP